MTERHEAKEEKSRVPAFPKKEGVGHPLKDQASALRGGIMLLICTVCRSEFAVTAFRKDAKYCSQGCYRKARKEEAGRFTEKHFWRRVKKTDGCWEWDGKPVTKGGYCRYNDTLAHRKSWELTNGPIPEGVFVLHKCDNPRCVRPDHLFLGDQQANMADMIAKGRKVVSPRYGDKNHLTKISDSTVLQIRHMAPGKKQAELAEMFGVSRAQVCRILSGKSRVGCGD